MREAVRFNIDYVIQAIAWRLPNWLFYYYHTYLISTVEPKLTVRTYTTYFKRLVTLDDLPLLTKLGIAESLVRERLAAGDRCVIMGQGEEIMSIIWGCAEKRYLRLSGSILDPGEDGIILYAGYTNEQARLRGLFPTSFNELYQSYLTEGRRRIYSAIHSLNTNSLALHQRMSFDIVGETYFWDLFGVKICYYKTWPHRTRKVHIFGKIPPDGLYWI